MSDLGFYEKSPDLETEIGGRPRVDKGVWFQDIPDACLTPSWTVHRNPLLITAITIQDLPYRQAAQKYGVSRSWIHELHQRYLTEGHAGADTIHTYLAREVITVSRSTIWLTLHRDGHITPQPQKRPRSSWQRFNAATPNETWQSDFTHIRLTTGEDIEVIGWLDDHSRYLLHLSAHRRVTGTIVTDTFQTAAATHGYPASTLTDNGMVYTTRLAQGGKQAGLNAFETLLRLEGVTQKNGRPYKPTTQGKIERF